jgi:CMP-N-acetylneuraminic acid synthetase
MPERIMTEPSYSALVLAGSRRGAEDPLAKHGKVSHKCFIAIGGEPMLRTVARALLDSGCIARVIVSIDEDAMEQAISLLKPLKQSDRIVVLPCRPTIAASVNSVFDQLPDILPLVITTGDNALHTPEIVRHFCQSLDSSKADAAFGLTRAEVLLAEYPKGDRAFHCFRDVRVSGCNLYALLNQESVDVPRVFDSGGQFAKKPWRFLFSFGLLAFLVYKSRLATLGQFTRLLSRALRIKAEPIWLPFPEAPIDIDRLADWRQAEEIIEVRRLASGTAGKQARWERHPIG